MKKTLITLAMVMASGSTMATEAPLTGGTVDLTASVTGTAAQCTVTETDATLNIGFGSEGTENAGITVESNFAGATANLSFSTVTGKITNLDSETTSTADIKWYVDTNEATGGVATVALTKDAEHAISIGAEAVGFTADNILFNPNTGAAGTAEVTTTVTITCSDYTGDSAANGADA